MQRAPQPSSVTFDLSTVIQSVNQTEWVSTKMNASPDQDRDFFAVQLNGKVATVNLYRVEAGWFVHVMVEDDPDGDTLFFGHGFGPLATVEAARAAGATKANALLGGAPRDGYMLQAAAIERIRDPGNFDAVIEAVDGSGNVTDRHFIKLLNGTPQSERVALLTASRALRHVRGVNSEGKIFN
ncbi:hypothetical protein I5U05_002080 [Stenotrophomonas maltophilia]|nr:hypothetical protein [Stenotrophomonas maltophilia]MBH1723666.1 hypothetical protein [Stenotrophomonas maltophilia]MBH1800795.1 hypothetical protein [Stenotrophomonas maltophilia]MBH1807187.1 hypothetical protein [Stenotrophomonas maltophilia]